ncbi:hypothetical protein M422DRAFT_268580 [Sphaerobolus stellatus SS14]|uniref:Cytochrome P450 n=1 Tax=Sphaerobolus stellatus (strain SS14) TaxID=990650 RepID=A0A0C9U6P5_SPHS4|nr:hypothetical protein M422DRAFT_268580 [Sphaerobolus stellatus SS14]
MKTYSDPHMVLLDAPFCSVLQHTAAGRSPGDRVRAGSSFRGQWVPALFTKRQLAPFPPGPEPLPILGNILSLPQTQPWKTFAKWGKEYGGIAHATALGTHFIIINDPKFAIELLEKKGKLYSDRLRLMMGGELVGWGEGPALSQFTDTWSEYRRLMALFIGSRAKIDSFNDVLQNERNEFLKRMLDEPNDFVHHCRNFAGSIVLQLTYGYKATSDNDPLVKLVTSRNLTESR